MLIILFTHSFPAHSTCLTTMSLQGNLVSSSLHFEGNKCSNQIKHQLIVSLSALCCESYKTPQGGVPRNVILESCKITSTHFLCRYLGSLNFFTLLWKLGECMFVNDHSANKFTACVDSKRSFMHLGNHLYPFIAGLNWHMVLEFSILNVAAVTNHNAPS